MNAAPSGRERRLRALRRGRRGEWICRWHLRLRGWRIIAVDWRCPSGEIDIVARRGAVLAAIEVKARDDLARAGEAVLWRQRRRVSRAAMTFLLQRPDLAHLGLRFDAMLIVPGRLPLHLPDAWRLDT